MELKEKKWMVQDNKKEELKEDNYVKKIQETQQRQKEEACLSYVLWLFYYMYVDCWTWTNKLLCFMDIVLLIQNKENSEAAMMLHMDYRSSSTNIHL